MSAKAIKTLEVRTRQEWRNWLQQNHGSESEIWLVFHKRHTGLECIRRLDDVRYARKFTPRTLGSRWSTINRRRYADLKSCGLLTAPGLARPPTSRGGDAPQPSVSLLPSYIEKGLKANARAWEYFQRLAPSYRRAYIGWIESAKRGETKENAFAKPLVCWRLARSWG